MTSHELQSPSSASMMNDSEPYGAFANLPTAADVGASSNYITIGMYSPNPDAASSITSSSGSTYTSIVGSGTSTFKTPLLPMPTLEDIEGSVVLLPPPPLSQQHLQHQETQNLELPPPPASQSPAAAHQPIPGGILKYPHSANAPHSNYGSAPSTHITAAMSAAATTVPSAAVELQMSNTPACISSTAVTESSLPPATISSVLSNSSTMTIASIKAELASVSKAASTVGNNTSAINRAASTSSPSKCCACFRRNNKLAKNTKTPSKKHKSKQPSMWSAVLTNLGIFTLFLGYTLLGSFIFLTIEDVPTSSSASVLSSSLHHTLASTKRGGGGAALTGNQIFNRRGGSSNTFTTQRLDNGTMAQVVRSDELDASASSAEISDGGAVLNAFGSGEDGSAKLGLAAEAFDVRQRTIENIWDITVSLNILYKENWTKLAALEIAKFQDQLIKRINEDALLQLSYDMEGIPGNSPATEAVLLHSHHHDEHEWNFAKSFLYSLTVLTTIGYGNIAPRTTLGRLKTLIYAIFGIPLTLIYLSSTGGILAKVAREVFSKALCCCLCSNCGYCCYDEKRMAEKERRTKRKRQQEELRKQQAVMQEPYYVRSGSMSEPFPSNEKIPQGPFNYSSNLPSDIDSLSASDSRGSMHGLSILAPILLCLCMMIIYIVFGAAMLLHLENWPLVDGIYFCFMSLSTIGFGDMMPGLRRESTVTTWFCSIYIMSGMALTAMCFNVIHEEIVHRIKIVVEFKESHLLEQANVNGRNSAGDAEHGAYFGMSP